MPTYPVINKETGEQKELSMSMMEYGEWRDEILTGIKTGMQVLLPLEKSEKYMIS